MKLGNFTITKAEIDYLRQNNYNLNDQMLFSNFSKIMAQYSVKGSDLYEN